MRRLAALLLALALISPAAAQTLGSGNLSAGSITATGSTTARTLANRAAEQINLKDYGALGDAQGWINGAIAAASNILTVPTATFTAADIGKAITVTGSGTAGATQSGTITGYTSVHVVTVSFSAVIATPYVGALYATVGTAQSGAGSYAPGDTVTSAAGSPITPAVFVVLDTALSSATVNAAGAGGVDGACVLTGTTGTVRTGATATRFSIAATITAGAISSLGAISAAGDYTTNPTLTGEPVTSNCSLTGATLDLKMGASTITNLFHTDAGRYASLPAGAQATTTSGSGTGLTMTIASPAVLGGQVTYGTDDSAALAAAVTKANALYSAGSRSVIYVPPGNYFLKGTTIPTFVGSGSLSGDAAFKSTFYIDPTFVGDVFSWSNAWLGIVGSFPTPGNTSSLSLVGYGPTVERISIIGDLSAPTQQNAFMFYNRNDFIEMQDINVMYLNGRSLCLGCALKSPSTVAYSRESRFSRLRFNQVGQAGVPALEIGAIAAGLADDLRFSQVDIYGMAGPGLVIRGTAGAAIGELHFSQLRVEGSEYGWPAPVGDHIQIGDPAFPGVVSNLYFDQVQLVSPYSGSYAIHLAGVGASAAYYINFTNTNITGGFPLGSGIKIDGGRSLDFDISNIYTFGTNFTLASSAFVSGPIRLAMNGAEQFATYDVDATSVNFINVPVAKRGLPGGNALGVGSLDLQSGRTTAAQTATGSLSTIMGGVNNTLSGASAVITHGSNNLSSGTYSRIGGFRISDRGRYGTDCYGSGFLLNAQGESQTCVNVLRAVTTSATPTTLTSNLGAAASSTCVNIPNNYIFGVEITLVANNRTTSGNDLSWRLGQGLLKRGVGAATTTWSQGTPTTLSDGAAGTVTAAADTTNGCLALQWTAPNTDTWDVTARVVTVENW